MTSADKKRIEDLRSFGPFSFGSEAAMVEIKFLITQLDEAHAELRNIKNNYDHDMDAHKYGTLCRCCEAAKILGES